MTGFPLIFNFGFEKAPRRLELPMSIFIKGVSALSYWIIFSHTQVNWAQWFHGNNFFTGESTLLQFDLKQFFWHCWETQNERKPDLVLDGQAYSHSFRRNHMTACVALGAQIHTLGGELHTRLTFSAMEFHQFQEFQQFHQWLPVVWGEATLVWDWEQTRPPRQSQG